MTHLAVCLRNTESFYVSLVCLSYLSPSPCKYEAASVHSAVAAHVIVPSVCLAVTGRELLAKASKTFAPRDVFCMGVQTPELNQCESIRNQLNQRC